ncbi:MAG: XRE family transcriptional regulator [Thermomicrobiales bacterium]
MIEPNPTQTLRQQTVAASVHHQAVAASVSEVAGLLQELLSRRLTAYIAGVKDGKTVTRWANGEVTEIRDHGTEQRLRAAYEIAQLLLSHDSPQTVKVWFIGLDPALGDTAPAEAIRAGRLQEAFSAARAFLAHG